MAINFPNLPTIGQTHTVGTATYRWSGTSWDAVSAIPQGYTGSKGDIGFTGSASTVQGPIGYSGSQGVTGYVGSQGATGYVGSQGVIGYTGSQGAPVATVDASAPASPVMGQLWFDTGASKLKVWTGSAWTLAA